MKYVPDSAQMRQHTLSDGPYADHEVRADEELRRSIATRPGTRAPILCATPTSTDRRSPKGLSSESVQQQIEAGTGDMEWDIQPPAQDLPRLISSNDQRLIIGPSGPVLVAHRLLPRDEPVRRPDEEQARPPGGRRRASTRTRSCRSSAAQASRTCTTRSSCPATSATSRLQRVSRTRATAIPPTAKALLAKAGFPNGAAIKLLYSTSDPAPRICPVDAVEPQRRPASRSRSSRPRRLGLLRQVPAAAEHRQARRLGHRRAGMDPGLVRQQRPLDHPAVVHESRAWVERLRRLRQPGDERAGQPGADGHVTGRRGEAAGPRRTRRS